jgi:hypothetical protein
VSGSLLFTATSDSAVLQFSSLVGGPRGAVIDDITVAAVPEPHEWVMMLAGLGLVGWVAGRRRRAADATAFA